jgi:hypothetical protein
MSILEVQFADGQAAQTFRENLIARLEELFAYGFFSEVIARSSGTPSSGDPAGLTTISHTISGYTNTPKVILIPKSDWHCYISSVSNVSIVVGVGAYGSGTTLDYDLIVTSTDIPA